MAKQGGPFTARDLYPFQLALYQIDSLRKDGKFEGRDGSVPEGQAILNALLSEAHESESTPTGCPPTHRLARGGQGER